VDTIVHCREHVTIEVAHPDVTNATSSDQPFHARCEGVNVKEVILVVEHQHVDIGSVERPEVARLQRLCEVRAA